MPLPIGKAEVKDGSLTIKNLSYADSGVYECVATNSMGTKKAKMNVVLQKQPGLKNFKRRFCRMSGYVIICAMPLLSHPIPVKV